MICSSSCTRLCTTLVALALVGCASAPRQGAEQDRPCDTPKSAVAGAVLGALAGAVIGGRDGAVKGAAIGAVAGAVACATVSSQSRQTKTAAQVDAEQARRPVSVPRTPVLVTYSPRLMDTSVSRGAPARLASTLELANGSAESVREVVEELVIIDPAGQQFRSGSKSFAGSSAGRFENSFEIVLPSQAPTGRYTLSTNVYVNGKLATSRSVQLQVV